MQGVFDRFFECFLECAHIDNDMVFQFIGVEKGNDRRFYFFSRCAPYCALPQIVHSGFFGSVKRLRAHGFEIEREDCAGFYVANPEQEAQRHVRLVHARQPRDSAENAALDAAFAIGRQFREQAVIARRIFVEAREDCDVPLKP
jgi:hypothetical protein